MLRDKRFQIGKTEAADMDKLNKANVYIQENHIPKEKLPVFHITPPCGWMNDPNGFSSFEVNSHLFYQFLPFD